MARKTGISGEMEPNTKSGNVKHPGSKRMLNMWILDILSQFSSKKRPMTYQRIIEELKKKYQFGCTRSTLGDYIHDFESDEFRQLFGCYARCDKRGAGYYLERELSDGDLRLLIDSIMSIRSLSSADVKELIAKLIRRGSTSFQAKVKGYTSADLMGLPHSPNTETLDNVAILNEAMVNGRQASFVYNDFSLDAKNRVFLNPCREKRYVVNPYRLTVYSSRLYLVCNTVPHENISMYRVDKMTDVAEESEQGKPWREIDKQYNPPKTMVESLHMFSTDPVNVEFWVENNCLRDVVDWFGGNQFKVLEQEDERLRIGVRCSETAMQFWAMSYGEYVEIIKPKSLREKMRGVALQIAERHE